MARSLLDGVEDLLAARLAISKLRHRSALKGLRPFEGIDVVAEIHRKIAENYEQTGARSNINRSQQNWRWQSLQPQISAHNRSPEVVIERAIAAACVAGRRDDWANQVPVASGLVKGAGDGRRAIDLVRWRGEKHFELIELKIASDTPLYAAVEIIGYACIWLLATQHRPSHSTALLDADTLNLRVLAPRPYYSGYELAHVENAFDEGVRALGKMHDVQLTFGFNVLDEKIRSDDLPDSPTLLDLLDHSRPLHTV